MWNQHGYCPVATFDYKFEGQESTVTIGMFNDTLDAIDTSVSNPDSEDWALTVVSASIGSSDVEEDLLNTIALLSSDYPYIAVPEELWTPFKANLTELGFACDQSPFPSFTHCQVAKTCDLMSYYLEDLVITFNSLEGDDFDVKIPPTIYLMQH